MNSKKCSPDFERPLLSRRDFLGRATAAVAASLLPATSLCAAEDSSAKPPVSNHRYKIAVCDWMILKRQKLGAFALTKEIGADGVEVDMGGLGQRETFDNKLADPKLRQQFLAKAHELHLEISSLAMSGFYAQSFPERAGVERMVQDCIDTMTAMGIKVAFLPLGVQGDLVKRPELRPPLLSVSKPLHPAPERPVSSSALKRRSTRPARSSCWKMWDHLPSKAISTSPMHYKPGATCTRN